jgi:integrase
MGKQRYKASYRAYIGKTSDGKSHYKRFTGYSYVSEKMAMKAAKLEAQSWRLKNLSIKERTPSIMTVGDAMDSYIALKSNILSPATIRGYCNVRNNRLQDLMDIPIDSITQVDVQRAVNIEAIKTSPKTVRNAHGLLTAVLKVYVPDLILHTTLPQPDASEFVIPCNEDIESILEAIREEDNELYKAVLLAAFGSLRRSEISALMLDDIKGDTIRICKVLVPDRNNQFVVKNRAKSKAGNRTITMPHEVIEVLKSTPDEEGHIVSINPQKITARFHSAMKRHNFKSFRFHDLRHYQASILHAMGVPDKYIMERGGWKTDSTLKNIYQHTMDEKRKEVENQICAYFSDAFGIAL